MLGGLGILGLGHREDEWHESHGGKVEDLHESMFHVFVQIDFVSGKWVTFLALAFDLQSWGGRLGSI
jgi:hypothetical protein